MTRKADAIISSYKDLIKREHKEVGVTKHLASIQRLIVARYTDVDYNEARELLAKEFGKKYLDEIESSWLAHRRKNEQDFKKSARYQIAVKRKKDASADRKILENVEAFSAQEGRLEL